MEYYHVRVTQKSDRSHDEVRLDLTREELEERFLAPYRRGLPIIIGGKSILNNDIERIRITKTDQDSSHLGKVVDEERSRRIASGVLDIAGPSKAARIANKGEDVSDELITGPPGSDSNPASHSIQEVRPATDAREVFVVHGRNLRARDALFGFLGAIDLHPLEWSEAVSATGKPSPYIGEILQTAFSSAHAVVVLLTPDDEVRLKPEFRTNGDPPHETQLTGQARPNVLFEAGMAMGSQPERVVLVELGNLRPFTDIAGLHIVRMDDSFQHRQELAQKLRTAGCPVNVDGVHWHTAGRFDAAISDDAAPLANTHDTGTEEQKSLDLSKEAQELLIAAAQDRFGLILKLRTMGGLIVESNGKSFVKGDSARAEAKWEQAMEDLHMAGCIKPEGDEGESFRITQRGYDIADSLNSNTAAP